MQMSNHCSQIMMLRSKLKTKLDPMRYEHSLSVSFTCMNLAMRYGSHPFGSVIRSLMVAIYELGVTEVMVIAHSDCGACHMSSAQMIEHMKARGIKQETIDMIRFCGVDFESWLYGFEDTEKSVKGTVEAIINHPLIPNDINVSGFIIDSVTGELTPVQ